MDNLPGSFLRIKLDIYGFLVYTLITWENLGSTYTYPRILVESVSFIAFLVAGTYQVIKKEII